MWWAPLSDFADQALQQALGAVVAARTPGEEPRGFAVIALGKLGSRELNYSSDVDLLYLYDPAVLPRRAREEPAQAGVRIGQALTDLIQKRDGEGYVFRVDLRLRPSPEVTPIALPVDAAISHYESSALPWERAAFIRARHVAGDAAVGRYFLEAIHPFVWRRSLDFGAIGELQSITGRIRDHYADGQAFGPGYDLKRGRGGIREIEFFAHMHQLIHGGRQPALRTPGTQGALAALAAAGRIAAGEAEQLAAAYRLLRTIEHRLQMIEDRQTHSLPDDPAALEAVAGLHGLAGGGGRAARPVAAACGARGGGVRGRRPGGHARPAACARQARGAADGGGLRRSRRGREPDRGVAIGQAAVAADGCGARRVRGDAAGSDRRVRRGAGQHAGDQPVRRSGRQAAERRQSVPAAGGAAGPCRSGRHRHVPRARARRPARPATGAARRADRRVRIRAGAAWTC
jgi:glutamate-ammonia-ligase adenylyltransferase